MVHDTIQCTLYSYWLLGPADRVRVRSGLQPSTGWGSVSASSVGIVSGVPTSGDKITVRFREQSDWVGVATEMEIVPASVLVVGDFVKLSEDYMECDNAGDGPLVPGIAGRIVAVRVLLSLL